MVADDPVAALHAAVTGSPDLGSYPDTLVDRLMDALSASWRLLDDAGLTGKVPVIAGIVGGPWTPGGPPTLLADSVEQVTARYRRDDQSRWRTSAEAARQLEANLALLDTATGSPPAPGPAPGPAQSWPDALWVGEIGDRLTAVGGKSDDGSTYGNVQYQRVGGSITNSPEAPQVPVVEHPLLGRCLKLSLGSGVMRHEVQTDGTADSGWGIGSETWCGFDFALAADFPLSSTDRFSVINQVHQSSSSGSPPLEFDAHSGGLWIRGSSTGYNRRVCDLERDRVYRVVFGLKLGTGTGTSTINVYVDGEHLIRDYRPRISFGTGCYWKVASGYASGSIRRPFTTFQKSHRIGRTYASVA